MQVNLIYDEPMVHTFDWKLQSCRNFLLLVQLEKV